jgi:hypothetical protein
VQKLVFSLGSLAFVPVIEQQVFSPVKKSWVVSGEASLVYSSSDLAKAYASLFLNENS